MNREKAINRFEDYLDTYKVCHRDSCIAVSVDSEDAEAFALAVEALDDIGEISTAVYKYEESYRLTVNDKIDSRYADAYRIAEKWYEKEHVTRKSIIKTQLEEIMNHFTDPVTYDELIKTIQEMKEDTERFKMFCSVYSDVIDEKGDT